MILDITRHKFFEGLVTLLLFAAATAVAIGVAWAGLQPSADMGAMPPLRALVSWLSTSYPVLSVLAIVPMFIYAVLRLSRATARASIYPQSTLAAIALCAVTLFAVIPSAEYASLMVVALLMAESLGRLLYCFGPYTRAHYLFTSMLALGSLPLVDAPLVVLTIVVSLFTLLLRGTLRELIIIVVGILLPSFIACYVEWLMGGSFEVPMAAIRDSLVASSLSSVVGYLTLPRLIFVGVLVFLLLSSLILYFSNRVSLSGGVRNVWLVLQLALLFMLAVMFGLGVASPAVIVAIAVIAVPMLPMLFICVSPFISVVAYLLYIIAAFVAQF